MPTSTIFAGLITNNDKGWKLKQREKKLADYTKVLIYCDSTNPLHLYFSFLYNRIRIFFVSLLKYQDGFIIQCDPFVLFLPHLPNHTRPVSHTMNSWLYYHCIFVTVWCRHMLSLSSSHCSLVKHQCSSAII